MSTLRHTKALLDFIDTSPSPWHVVKTVVAMLENYHFQRLDETQLWQLTPGGRYFVVRGDSSIIAFIHANQAAATSGFKIIGAHTDSPGLRIKPRPLSTAANLAKLHVDIYGSPILATFSDRELSLAGRVNYQTRRGERGQTLLHVSRPLLRLPNLAIHLNRGVNEEGLKFQKQNELALILAETSRQLAPGALEDFTSLLLPHLPDEAKHLLSWDIAVYDTQKGNIWGLNNEFFAHRQLDNLASCHSALTALLDEKRNQVPQSTLVCAFFDHEEVGSESHCGAASHFLTDTLKRISDATSNSTQDFARALARSFMISADMAHAYHPHFPSVYDTQHAVHINQGVVIKINVNQRYATDSVSQAMFMNWCQQAKVPYQLYSHRNDLPCGSTIGNIVAKLGLRTVDVGCPMWAMHSCRESAGVFDHNAMIDVMRYFFSTSHDDTL